MRNGVFYTKVCFEVYDTDFVRVLRQIRILL